MRQRGFGMKASDGMWPVRTHCEVIEGAHRAEEVGEWAGGDAPAAGAGGEDERGAMLQVGWLDVFVAAPSPDRE